MKRYVDVIKKVKGFLPRKKYVLLFLSGFLLASLFYFYSEDKYEKEVFSAMAKEVYAEAGPYSYNPDTLALKALHLTHYLAERRLTVFGDKNSFNSIQSSLIQPVTDDLMTARGACGSFSYVLSRLLEEMEIDCRIAQMKANGQYGSHMVVEAKTQQGWVVLDPIFDQYFVNADGSLASFADVKANWGRFSKQVNASYDLAYAYEDARYTNWNKVPVVMPAIKKVLYWTIGKKETDGLSIRSLFLRKYHVLFLTTLLLLVLEAWIVFRMYMKRKQYRLPVDTNKLWSNKERHSPLPA